MRLKHLTDSDRNEFIDEFTSSFDAANIAVVLMRQFGLAMNLITNPTLPWPNQALEIINNFNGRNELEQLLRACRDARPNVEIFGAMYAKYAAARILTHFSPEPETGWKALSDGLQKHQRDGEPYTDPQKIWSEFSKIDTWTCQILTDHGSGTGLLVGNDLVLTCDHVISKSRSQDSANKLTNVFCVFDRRRLPNGNLKSELKVQATQAVCSSPVADGDRYWCEFGRANSHPGLLDYALIRLISTVGARPIDVGGENRGHYRIIAPPRRPEKDGAALIFQHPQNYFTMVVDLGSVTDMSPVRFRHNVNTEGGSSGAPVFDARARLVGIHQAGFGNGSETRPGYNQGIPLDVIMHDAQAKSQGALDVSN